MVSSSLDNNKAVRGENSRKELKKSNLYEELAQGLFRVILTQEQSDKHFI
jgi:hypothetical protein